MTDQMTDDPEAVIAQLEHARRAGLIADEECVSLAMAAANVRKGDGQEGSNVHDWRRGDAADSGSLTPGTPIATFLNRQGHTSDRYAGGGSGTRGAGLDHAAVFQRYVTDESGRRVGMEVAEQYAGSGGMHTQQYSFGAGWGERNGSNYYEVRTEHGPLGTRMASAGEASGNYLVARQRQHDEERRETASSSHPSIDRRNTAGGASRHLAHLHEIHEHLSRHTAQIADLEARIERKHRKGVVTDVDPVKHLYRQEIGRDCDGSNQVKSPWLPYAQIAGGPGGLNIHRPPKVGEQYMLINPDGSPDFTQALGVPHGWYTQNPSPSTDPDSEVTTHGTTVTTRSASSFVRSIGGTLTGALKSLISGGITLTHDAMGHHISAPGAMVDSTAETHTHTSSGSHTDTAMNGLSRISQNGNIDCTAINGAITHNAKSLGFTAETGEMTFKTTKISFS